MSEITQMREVTSCEKHADESLDKCLFCRIEELEKSCKWCGAIHERGQNTLCPFTIAEREIKSLEEEKKAIILNLSSASRRGLHNRIEELEGTLKSIVDGFVIGNCTDTYVNIAGIIREEILRGKS